MSHSCDFEKRCRWIISFYNINCVMSYFHCDVAAAAFTDAANLNLRFKERKTAMACRRWSTAPRGLFSFIRFEWDLSASLTGINENTDHCGALWVLWFFAWCFSSCSSIYPKKYLFWQKRPCYAIIYDPVEIAVRECVCDWERHTHADVYSMNIRVLAAGFLFSFSSLLLRLTLRIEQ